MSIGQDVSNVRFCPHFIIVASLIFSNFLLEFFRLFELFIVVFFSLYFFQTAKCFRFFFFFVIDGAFKFVHNQKNIFKIAIGLRMAAVLIAGKILTNRISLEHV